MAPSLLALIERNKYEKRVLDNESQIYQVEPTISSVTWFDHSILMYTRSEDDRIIEKVKFYSFLENGANYNTYSN